MARAFVLLLILPTLLMPPGVCICRIVPLAGEPVAPLSPRHAALSHAVSPRPDCSCNSCRTRTAAACGQEDQTPPDRGPAGPRDHWPGCPAAVGAVPLSMVVPTAAVTPEFPATVGFFTPVVEAVAFPARVTAAPSPAASPPLFISFCTLLI